MECSLYDVFIITIFFSMHEACPKSKDSKVLNIHNIFNLQKGHRE